MDPFAPQPVQSDDLLHCYAQNKIISVAGLATFIASTAGLQFSEGTANTTPANPASLTTPALYLGRTSGGDMTSLYIWSITLAQWIAIITP